MSMLILTLHITAALIMSAALIVVFVAGVSRRATRGYYVMLGSFSATLLSGIGLIALSAGGLGRFCAMMTAFTALTIAVRSFYRRRLEVVAL